MVLSRKGLRPQRKRSRAHGGSTKKIRRRPSWRLWGRRSDEDAACTSDGRPGIPETPVCRGTRGGSLGSDCQTHGGTESQQGRFGEAIEQISRLGDATAERESEHDGPDSGGSDVHARRRCEASGPAVYSSRGRWSYQEPPPIAQPVSLVRQNPVQWGLGVFPSCPSEHPAQLVSKLALHPMRSWWSSAPRNCRAAASAISWWPLPRRSHIGPSTKPR